MISLPAATYPLCGWLVVYGSMNRTFIIFLILLPPTLGTNYSVIIPLYRAHCFANLLEDWSFNSTTLFYQRQFNTHLEVTYLHPLAYGLFLERCSFLPIPTYAFRCCSLFPSSCCYLNQPR